MANLIFPQLSSGALVQYPLRRLALTRTVKNIAGDGSMIVAADPNSQRLIWQLTYQELSLAEVSAIQNHFSACAGPLRAFTFIDPTGNMLAESSNLKANAWSVPSTVSVDTGISDADGGAAGFSLTNTGAAAADVIQQLPVPANYQYCFSVYARSQTPSPLTLVRESTTSVQETICNIGSTWSRYVVSGALADPTVGFSVGIRLEAGQNVFLYGPQLEPQLAPSTLRPTFEVSGVYQHSHWVNDELIITADAPNLFSTSFSIETNLGS